MSAELVIRHEFTKELSGETATRHGSHHQCKISFHDSKMGCHERHNVNGDRTTTGSLPSSHPDRLWHFLLRNGTPPHCRSGGRTSAGIGRVHRGRARSDGRPSCAPRKDFGTTTHRRLPPASRPGNGIRHGTVRISCIIGMARGWHAPVPPAELSTRYSVNHPVATQ